MLLTLDLATVLGFTIGHVSDHKFASGYFRLPSTGPDIGAFAVAYDKWLGDRLTNVTEVVFECPILPKKKTTLATVRKLSGLAWHTEFLCSSMGIRCFEAHLQQVKKAIGGHGRSSKHDMIAAVRAYGYDVEEENEADAIAVRLFTILSRHKELAADFNLQLGPLGVAAFETPF
jgi:crossover junction endodeoxyribonuclease RuvC